MMNREQTTYKSQKESYIFQSSSPAGTFSVKIISDEYRGPNDSIVLEKWHH